MACLWSLSSVCFSHNPRPSPLRHTSPRLPCLRFRFPKTNSPRIPICRVSSKVGLPNLQADQFSHPYDLKMRPPIKPEPDLVLCAGVARSAVRTLLERGHFPSEVIDEGAVLASQTEHSDTYKLMVETAEILDMTPPLLFIRNHEKPFACAVGLDMPYIIVHSCLLQLLTPQELQAVLAHELAHLKCDHYVPRKIVDKLATDSSIVSEHELPIKDFFRWYQSSEFSCDRASLIVVQDLKVVVSSIMKLVEGCPSMVEEAEVDQYLAAAHAYSAVPSFKLKGNEPSGLQRAYEVDVWSKSDEYKSLLTGAKESICC